jgi:hypothetical protein
MRNYRVWKVLKIVLMVIIGALVFGYMTMSLWNALIPAIFGLKTITFWQALGLILLGKILFGGFHRHGGGGPRGWKRHMAERWANMTPEEREKFRAGMRGRGRCGFGRQDEPVSQQTTV